MTLTIFDCDGVLIDSELIACAADAEALSEIGYEITTDEMIARFSGMPDEAVYATVEAELGHSLPQGFGQTVKQKILSRYRTDLRAIEGAAEVLSALPGRKCVASSADPTKLALGLIETGLYDALCPHVYSTALVARGKPYPDIFEYAAKMMGAMASDCLVVEDSVAGITAARRAGMRAIGFVGGAHCPPGHADLLRAAGASDILTNLRALPQHIGQSVSRKV